MPGGNPVIAVPGETPRSPLITVNPVLVTVVAPRTPNVAADPRLSCPLMRPGNARPQVIRAWHFILIAFDVVTLGLSCFKSLIDWEATGYLLDINR